MSSEEGRVLSMLVARLRRMDDDEIEGTVMDFIDRAVDAEIASLPARLAHAFFAGLASGAAIVGCAWWMLG